MSVALYVSRLPSRFGRFFAPTVSYASSFARYQHTSARVLTPSDSKGPQPSFPCMLNSFPRHNRKLCPQIEAPMRFEGEWKRCSSNGVSKYAFARLDFVVTLVLDPSTWAISSVKLGLEKRGRLPASQEKYLPPHRRYTGELVANIQLEVSLEQLKELMSGDIDSKSVFELSALNDLTNEESSGSLTGKIGFQNRYASAGTMYDALCVVFYSLLLLFHTR